MEKVCDVAPKNLRKNFRVEELSRHDLFFVISQ